MASSEISDSREVSVSYFDIVQCERCVRSLNTQGTVPFFLKAVTVWLKKPHVVNKRLCGAKLISIQRFDTQRQVDDYLNAKGILFNINSSKKPQCEIELFEDFSAEIIPYTVIIRELIPKSEFFPKVYEAVVYDLNAKRVIFIPLHDKKDESSNCSTIEIPYSVCLNCPDSERSNEIVLSWSCDHEEPDVPKRQMSSRWLSTVLLEKLVNWSHISDISTSITSLQLVDVDEYQKTYIRLKNKYGRDLVKNWTESTDPQKFVYEDIAIASYLLLIWEEDRVMKNLQHKQSFVDLGCGNGLLVYILTREGHKGLGIDLRKRKIWDTFGTDIDLQETTITPCGDHLFPKYDWIIGNHSDELTPWIPVISARSSYNSCFFVLPCCHYDFVGKYTTTEKGKSKYASYLNFVKNVIVNCGFKPECDTLRIPSTKRISYIGRHRTYGKHEEDKADMERQTYINKFCESRQGEKESSSDSSKVDGALNVRHDSTSPSMSNQKMSCAEQSLDEHGCCIDSPNLESTESVDITTGPDKVCCSESHEMLTSNGHSYDVLASEKRKISNSSWNQLSMVNESAESTCSKKLRIENESDSSHVTDDGEMSNIKCAETSQTSQWVSDFQPRLEKKVRNCQSVASETKLKIVDSVFNLVLSAGSDNVVLLDDNTKWCKGGLVPLSKVVSLFDKSTLQELKSECGGLQTLLRNHSHIFQVTGGNVQLRDFTMTDPWEGRNPQKVKNKQQKTLKTTQCWFFDHHPDGCPRSKADCLFAHGKEDLREKS